MLDLNSGNERQVTYRVTYIFGGYQYTLVSASKSYLVNDLFSKNDVVILSCTLNVKEVCNEKL